MKHSFKNLAALEAEIKTGNISAVLFFGPDQEKAAQLFSSLALSISSQSDKDELEMASFTGQELKTSPGALVEQSMTLGLFSSHKLLKIVEAGDASSKAVSSFLESAGDGVFLIASADDLPTRSSLRQLFENSSKALAVGCYKEEGAKLLESTVHRLGAAGISLTADARQSLQAYLYQGTQITVNDIEKLKLYSQGAAMSGEDIKECLGAGASESDFDELLDALFGGNMQGIEKCLLSAKEEPYAVLRMISRHLLRLAEAREAMDAGKQADEAIKILRPPVFFKQMAAFKNHLRIWSSIRLAKGAVALSETERSMKSTGADAPLLLSRLFIRLAR